MKWFQLSFGAACCWLLFTSNASATVRYVDLNCASATPPYTDWNTAATNIQDAIDAADVGDQVLVTNGVYQTGGVVVNPGLLTNRVAVTKALTLKSVNGPAETVIQGYQVPGTIRDTNAIRCVYLADGAVMDGFTLTNGATFSSGSSSNCSGGGIWCASTNAIVLNCVIIGNSAAVAGGVSAGSLSNCVIQANIVTGSGGGANSSLLLNCEITGNKANQGAGAYSATLMGCNLAGNVAIQSGGGASGGRLANCSITGNSAGWWGGGVYSAKVCNSVLWENQADLGGGAHSATMTNCTLVGNSATSYGGGSYNCSHKNCIVYYNTASLSPNFVLIGGGFVSCCTTPLPTGAGNISAEPELASLSHISAVSPCRAAGNAAVTTGTDIDGETWTPAPTMGCDEYVSGSVTGLLSVGISAAHTTVAVGHEARFVALIAGRISASRWDFGDGTSISNRPFSGHKWTATGNYTVSLQAFNETYPEGVTATVEVQVVPPPVHYVKASNPGQAFPYTSWATAATSIQNAIDAASVPGAVVLVSNGLYATGARLHLGLTNRLVVTNSVVVKSVNGPGSTTIQANSPYGMNGPWAIRCVFLGDGAMLDGFTLTSGATQPGSDGISLALQVGGGIFCETSESVVTNCVIIGNLAGGKGGGVYGGTLFDCQISYNSAPYGSGISYATANRCVIKNNGESGGNTGGGGAYGGSLNNCLVISNSVSGGYGGGAVFASLNNCTIVSNSAASGGGVVNSKVTNCIVYFNSGSAPTPNFGEYSVGGITDTLLMNNCCTTPHPGVYGYSAGGNITNQPAFISFSAGNFHLQTNSPCVNTGSNAFVTASTDLDGNPRIVGLAVDIGAYEKSPVSILPTFWLLPYNLPNDGSADYLDSDGDGLNNWQEWKAGTIPTNALSVLKMASPSNSVSGMTVTWQSVSGVRYYLQRGTNLAAQPMFSSIASNRLGQAGTTSYTDTTATNDGPYFYRVGVQ